MFTKLPWRDSQPLWMLLLNPHIFSIFKSFALLTAPHDGLLWVEGVRHHCPVHQHQRVLLKFRIPRAPIQRPGTPAARTSLNVILPGLCACWWAQRATLTCHQQSAARLNPAPAQLQAPTGLPSYKGRGSLVCLFPGRSLCELPSDPPSRPPPHHHLFSPVAPRDRL